MKHIKKFDTVNESYGGFIEKDIEKVRQYIIDNIDNKDEKYKEIIKLTKKIEKYIKSELDI